MDLVLDCIVLRLFCERSWSPRSFSRCTCIAFGYKKAMCTFTIWLIIVVILIKISTIAIGVGISTFYDCIISYKSGIFFYIDEIVIILSVMCIVLMNVQILECTKLNVTFSIVFILLLMFNILNIIINFHYF